MLILNLQEHLRERPPAPGYAAAKEGAGTPAAPMVGG